MNKFSLKGGTEVLGSVALSVCLSIVIVSCRETERTSENAGLSQTKGIKEAPKIQSMVPNLSPGSTGVPEPTITPVPTASPTASPTEHSFSAVEPDIRRETSPRSGIVPAPFVSSKMMDSILQLENEQKHGAAVDGEVLDELSLILKGENPEKSFDLDCASAVAQWLQTSPYFIVNYFVTAPLKNSSCYEVSGIMHEFYSIAIQGEEEPYQLNGLAIEVERTKDESGYFDVYRMNSNSDRPIDFQIDQIESAGDFCVLSGTSLEGDTLLKNKTYMIAIDREPTSQFPPPASYVNFADGSWVARDSARGGFLLDVRDEGQIVDRFMRILFFSRTTTPSP